MPCQRLMAIWWPDPPLQPKTLGVTCATCVTTSQDYPAYSPLYFSILAETARGLRPSDVPPGRTQPTASVYGSGVSQEPFAHSPSKYVPPYAV